MLATMNDTVTDAKAVAAPTLVATADTVTDAVALTALETDTAESV